MIVVRINCDEKITTTQVMIVMCDDAADVDDSDDVGVSKAPHTAPLTEEGQTLLGQCLNRKGIFQKGASLSVSDRRYYGI